jgi:transposase
MRGKKQAQRQFVAMIDVNARIPEHHPIREIKRLSDEVFGRLSPRFEAMYSDIGRPSIPPERLLGARLLMALFSVPSERAFSRTVALRLAVPRVFGPGTPGGTLRCEHLQQKPAAVARTPSGRRVFCPSGRLTQGAGPVERGTFLPSTAP